MIRSCDKAVSDHESGLTAAFSLGARAGQLTTVAADELLDRLGNLMGAVRQRQQLRPARRVQMPEPGTN